MKFITENLSAFFIGELYQIADAVNVSILLGGLVLMWGVFRLFYRFSSAEWINLDFTLTPFEKDFWKKFLWYVGWACIQQSLVLLFASFMSSVTVSYIFSVVIFTMIYHFMNWRLMAFTGGFALVFYAAWFYFGFQSVLYIAILHAFGGTAYYKLGWDMRVWGIK